MKSEFTTPDRHPRTLVGDIQNPLTRTMAASLGIVSCLAIMGGIEKADEQAHTCEPTDKVITVAGGDSLSTLAMRELPDMNYQDGVAGFLAVNPSHYESGVLRIGEALVVPDCGNSTTPTSNN